jgi:lipopolysaccharide heptosyltransferase I
VRILFVKLGSIGDIVHTLPALAAVRRALPEAEITWVVEERSAEILRGNPMVDRLVEVDTREFRGGRRIDDLLASFGKQVKGLRGHKYDIAIDLQGLWKSAGIAKLSGAKKRFGFSRQALREPASRVLLTDTVEVPEKIHVIRKNLALVAGALGINVPNTDLEFPISTSEEHVVEAEAIVSTSGGGEFAILNPGGGWVTKLWHAEKFGQLADRLWTERGITPIVVTGPKEHELARDVAAASKCGRLVLAVPGLKAFYELARQAHLYIGGDTGPTHIAVAAGVPIVGLFGPTEWWRNGSPRPDDVCVDRTDISCRVDCHRRTCGVWICMDFGMDKVFEAVEQRLANHASLGELVA